ncbi:trypsin-like serine peptidase [Rhizobium wuzhouense]|uniref:Peptidase S1 domain-containing protein n=1 Tax=Rhizobium wuzhouense TaxID=1986026 RepID=A0ABX5NT63_9HYPH|nr:trypsin-like serine protease [Rhizobium wuzhouense]PYB73272.1 hypothetical protein DMY87_13270 [Rhizobium wuzhouense]
MFHIPTISAVFISLWCTTQALAAPEIENLANVDETQLSIEDFSNAEAMPLPSVTKEELAKMKSEFRMRNPDIPDQTSNQPQEDVPSLPGTLKKINAPWTDPPYWSAGRLNFINDKGKPRWCTAQFVAENVILTAAHCVFNRDKRVWYSNFVFMRASSEGDSPQKVQLRCISIYKTYYDPMLNYAYDYAFILTTDEDDRPPLMMETGTPASKTVTAIGYPQDPDRGRFMYRVKGSWLKVEGGIATMDNNPLKKGSSGGAWFTGFKAGSLEHDKNRVISLNSHRVENQSQTNGPLFTEDTVQLKKHVDEAKCLN